MIEVRPDRCFKASEEMRHTERRLRYEAENIESVCRALRRYEDESMHIIAAGLEKYAANVLNKSETTAVLHVMLEKIAGIYTRTENEVEDYIDRAEAVKAPEYGTMTPGSAGLKAKDIFEEFRER